VTSITDNWCISVKGWEKEKERMLAGIEYEIVDFDGKTDLIIQQAEKEKALQILLDSGIEIVGLHPKMQSLEELYLELDNKEEVS